MTTAPAKTSPQAKEVRKSIHRPSSDATRFHMSNDAVDVSVLDFASWTDHECIVHMARERWGDHRSVICPHCSCACRHPWLANKLRWKCVNCNRCFAVTTNTAFSGHKLPLRNILALTHVWACGAAGISSLGLRRIFGIKAYNTALNFTSRIREALVGSYNWGLMVGEIEMDGAHVSGRRASEKRGVPLAHRRGSDQLVIDGTVLTSAAKAKRRAARKAAIAAGQEVDPQYGTTLPLERRILIVAKHRIGTPGMGADVTRIGIAKSENPEAVEAVIQAFVCLPETILATDTGTAFPAGKNAQRHSRVNHSDSLSGPNGEHNNCAESFMARYKRAEAGIFINVEPKYLLDYAVEMAFREDHCRLAPGVVAERALHWALNSGLSQDWRGYTHGRHRQDETLAVGTRQAKASGPKKGSSPVAGVNGIAPF